MDLQPKSEEDLMKALIYTFNENLLTKRKKDQVVHGFTTFMY